MWTPTTRKQHIQSALALDAVSGSCRELIGRQGVARHQAGNGRDQNIAVHLNPSLSRDRTSRRPMDLRVYCPAK